ncbi:MAG: HDOD domain-containing protein [Nitrospirae bacterium]|nr:HDOD domain-containing protein [Nitrospirota bacterium]
MEDDTKHPGEALRIAVQKISNLPTIPVLAQEIIDTINNENADVRKLEDIVSRDPIISAKILSHANSALFGVSHATTTVAGAIARIGLNNVKNIALGVSMMTIFDSPRGAKVLDYERIFNHSLAVGATAEFIMRSLYPNSTEALFFDGILHDMGLLVLNRYFPELYSNVIIKNKTGIPLVDAEMQAMGFTHAQIGMWLAENWKLPDGIASTILNHHTPAMAAIGREKVAVIHLADFIISGNFFAVTRKSPNYMLDLAVSDILGLPDNKIEELTAKVTAYMISKGFEINRK